MALLAKTQRNHGKMKYFKGECENLSKVGLQIAKMHLDPYENKIKQWKVINQDFDNLLKKEYLKKNQGR